MGTTPLMEASYQNDWDTVRSLVRYQPPDRAPKKLWQLVGKIKTPGALPLGIQDVILEFLRLRRVDVHARDDSGRTAREIAEQRRRNDDSLAAFLRSCE
jgi:ankyrin repeat protein